MRHTLARLAAAAALTLALPMASATVLNFDTLKGSPTNMDASFGGLNWVGWQFYSTDQGNMPYTPASGETRLLTSSGNGNTISSDKAFTFQGAAFTGFAAVNGVTQNLQFDLYLGATKVYTSDPFQVSTTPTFVASGYNGAVDRVVVLNDASQHFVMDNLTFNETPLPVATAVPEPRSWLMAIAGLAALVLLYRRRASREA